MSETVIAAGEMVEGQVYKTCESELSYFSKFVSKKDGKVTIEALLPKNGKWKQLEVPEGYKVRGLSEAETAEFASGGKKVKAPKAPRDPNAPTKPAFKKVVGAVSGKGMIEAWAYYIDQNVRNVGGRALVIAAMLAEFPTKAESINKWVDAYLTYYNTGRFKGFARQEKSLPWILSEAEKAAGIKDRPVRDLTKKKKETTAPAQPAAV